MGGVAWVGLEEPDLCSGGIESRSEVSGGEKQGVWGRLVLKISRLRVGWAAPEWAGAADNTDPNGGVAA